MSKDDFSVLACKLLAYLYGCLKAGVKANARKAKDVVGCNDLYWEALLDDMSECGLIRVTATHASGKRYVSISEIRITMLNVGSELPQRSTEEEMDDAAKNMLILFVGVMFGAQGATEAVGKIAAKAAEAAAKRIPQQALTKGVVYPVVKKVATYLGVQMTKEIYGKGVAKIIPVIGGVVSGGITAASYVPMSKKLKRYLASLPVAKPETYAVSIKDDALDVSYEE